MWFNDMQHKVTVIYILYPANRFSLLDLVADAILVYVSEYGNNIKPQR